MIALFVALRLCRRAVAQRALGERFGIFIGLWAPTFMSIGNGIDNLSDDK